MCVPSRFDTGAGARFSIRIRRIRIVVGGAEGIPSWMNAAPEMAAIAATQPLGARFDSLRRPASKRADSAAAFSTSTPLSLNPLPHRRHHHHSLRYCSAVPFLFFLVGCEIGTKSAGKMEQQRRLRFISTPRLHIPRWLLSFSLREARIGPENGLQWNTIVTTQLFNDIGCKNRISSFFNRTVHICILITFPYIFFFIWMKSAIELGIIRTFSFASQSLSVTGRCVDGAPNWWVVTPRRAPNWWVATPNEGSFELVNR